MIKKVFKYIFAFVIGLYLIFAGGLFALNRIAAKGEAPEDSIESHSKEPHSFKLLSSGIHSLHNRLNLIEEAKSDISLEFFIYNLDEASRILTQALAKKASEGVKVRILVDFAAPVFQLKPLYARFLKTKGIQVHYYNTSSAYRLVSSQHRSHRKLLLIDGKAGMTGGRNIGNEYFDLSPTYNFLDTDVEIRGPIVASMLKSFDLYWNSNLSQAAEDIDKPLDAEEFKMAAHFFESPPGDQEILLKVKQKGSELAAASRDFICRDVSFITDFPNHGEDNRKVFQQIVNELKNAQKEVRAESPYFVIKPGGYEVLEELTKRGIALEILTNSLKSTDAFYTVATMLLKISWLAKSRITLKVFDGSPVEGQSFGESRWGLHSKRAVIDGKTVLVGTYNIDPRSANLNSELMVVCRNQPELASAFLADIQARSAHSAVAIENGHWNLSSIIRGASSSQLALTLLSLPLANLFDFLL